MSQKTNDTSLVVYLIGIAYLGAVYEALKQAVPGPILLLIVSCYLILLRLLGDEASKIMQASGWQRMSSLFRVTLLAICLVIAFIAGIVTGRLLPEHYAL